MSAIKKAFILLAHAEVARAAIKLGDYVQLRSFDADYERLPVGCDLVPKEIEQITNNVSTVKFLGLDDDGNARVRYSNKDVPVPFSVLESNVINAKEEVRLNSEYRANFTLDGKTVIVGCQEFSTEKVREVIATADKLQAAAVAVEATFSDNPSATYVPYVAPAKAAKKATKKTAKKATKKVAKKVAKRKPARLI